VGKGGRLMVRKGGGLKLGKGGGLRKRGRVNVGQRGLVM
jgi:hypothetical protein